MAGGLYNMSLSGTGWVAILSDGPPVLLNVAAAPTFADAQAAITWSGGVSTSIKTDFKMKNLIGRGSGESVQMAFSGQGWVLVQLSEGCSRFCELERSLTGISPRTLSLRLRALEEEGIVARQTYPEVPPRVEYALTPKGEALLPIIDSMRTYGSEWLGDDRCR